MRRVKDDVSKQISSVNKCINKEMISREQPLIDDGQCEPVIIPVDNFTSTTSKNARIGTSIYL